MAGNIWNNVNIQLNKMCNNSRISLHTISVSSKVHLKEFSAIFALKFELICTFCFLYCPTAICGIYILNNKLRGVSLKGNQLLPSLPDALNASWDTAGWGARGAWWEMEASLPAAVLEHRSVVRFPRALIREPPLRKHTCRQPMRHCPAAHTGPAYTLADTLANSANTHTHPPSEWGLLRVQPPGADLVCQRGKNIKSNCYRQTGWTSSSVMEGVFLSAGQETVIRSNGRAQPPSAHRYILIMFCLLRAASPSWTIKAEQSRSVRSDKNTLQQLHSRLIYTFILITGSLLLFYSFKKKKKTFRDGTGSFYFSFKHWVSCKYQRIFTSISHLDVRMLLA